MKKRFVMTISTLMIAIFCLLSVSALADFTVTTTGRLNLRVAPGTEYYSQGVVAKGKTLNVINTGLDSKGNTWYYVNNNGTTGWISAKYTRQGEVIVSRTVKMTGNANIRTGAGLYYNSIGVAKKGATATYLNAMSIDGRGVAWYKISYNGKTGWVSSMYSYVL